MKTGGAAVKTGKKHPSPLHTAALCIRMIFFSEKALYAVFLNNAHMFNLVCMFIVTLFIPYRDMEGNIAPVGMDGILEGLVFSMIFVALLFLYLPKTMPVFLGFLRVMLGFEIMSLFLPLTFLVPPQHLKIFHTIFLAWYLSLVVYAYSRIRGFGYIRSTVIVFLVFIFLMFIPALFS
ncbi:MAG: hypothetical protein AB7F25_11460 [Deferribacterales bacterium]